MLLCPVLFPGSLGATYLAWNISFCVSKKQSRAAGRCHSVSPRLTCVEPRLGVLIDPFETTCLVTAVLPFTDHYTCPCNCHSPGATHTHPQHSLSPECRPETLQGRWRDSKGSEKSQRERRGRPFIFPRVTYSTAYQGKTPPISPARLKGSSPYQKVTRELVKCKIVHKGRGSDR